ncbi:MAG: thioredoxin family protein [Ignavibacteriales bacterium]|nr:thioredoxin family protein [Ignavibacteriales bacterium]
MEIKILDRDARSAERSKNARSTRSSELKVAADVEKIADIKTMMSYGILATPGLVINGKVKCAGRIPRPEEIKAWIQEAAA